jgi:acetyl esterase/lipase
MQQRSVKRRRWAAVGFVVASVAATTNAYRPLARKGRLSMVAMALSLLATELPLQFIAGQLGVLSWVSRRLPRRLRQVVWLTSALSWLGLLGVHRVGRSADVPLTAALQADLEHGPPASDGATAKSPGLLRMVRIYRDYAHDADISYGPHGGANLLDIWRRPDLDRGGRAPVLLQVPGGAWTTGSKRGQAHPLMSHLADLGWVCVSINYRLSPRNTWPDHIVDVKQAIGWVKDNIGRYGGDPDFIAITGGSAGGHLSSLAALTPNRPEFQPGFEDADTSVQAAIPFYGVYDFTADGAVHPQMLSFVAKTVMKAPRAQCSTLFPAASPITYVGPQAPPFFVLHGRNDVFIPVEQAKSFVSRLREVSTEPVVYAELTVAQHAFDIFGSARAGHAAVAVERFLAEVRRRHQMTRDS